MPWVDKLQEPDPLDTTPDVDEIDLQIIAELQADSRKPTVEIARNLGIPRSTVARRIDRLVAENIITLGVFANGPKIGLPIQVIIEISLDPNQGDAIIDKITALDEVRWVGVVAGPFDLLVEAMLRSQTHLRHFLVKRLGRIEGITQLRTNHVLGVAKITFDWGLMLRAGEEAEREEARVSVGYSTLP